jgi:hypothetical protein
VLFHGVNVAFNIGYMLVVGNGIYSSQSAFQPNCLVEALELSIHLHLSNAKPMLVLYNCLTFLIAAMIVLLDRLASALEVAKRMLREKRDLIYKHDVTA